MLNQDAPKDYVLSSGETHSIKEFIVKAFKYAGISGCWSEQEGRPLSTKFTLNHSMAHTLVSINKDFYRPAEVDLLQGDSSPIRKELGWSPEVSFDSLVKKMVEYDIGLLRSETKKNK